MAVKGWNHPKKKFDDQNKKKEIKEKILQSASIVKCVLVYTAKVCRVFAAPFNVFYN